MCMHCYPLQAWLLDGRSLDSSGFASFEILVFRGLIPALGQSTYYVMWLRRVFCFLHTHSGILVARILVYALACGKSLIRVDVRILLDNCIKACSGSRQRFFAMASFTYVMIIIWALSEYSLYYIVHTKNRWLSPHTRFSVACQRQDLSKVCKREVCSVTVWRQSTQETLLRKV